MISSNHPSSRRLLRQNQKGQLSEQGTATSSAEQFYSLAFNQRQMVDQLGLASLLRHNRKKPHRAISYLSRLL